MQSFFFGDILYTVIGVSIGEFCPFLGFYQKKRVKFGLIIGNSYVKHTYNYDSRRNHNETWKESIKLLAGHHHDRDERLGLFHRTRCRRLDAGETDAQHDHQRV